jgi:hypothetical protein
MSGSIFCIMCRTLLYGSGRLPIALAVSLPGILRLSFSFSSMLFQPWFVRNTGKGLPPWRSSGRRRHGCITSQLDQSPGGAHARRDLAVGLALAASWFSVWGLYAAYPWTANAFGSTLQFARFYLPAAGAIALLGSWLVTRLPRLPRRASLAALISAAVAVAMFGLGAWSFASAGPS